VVRPVRGHNIMYAPVGTSRRSSHEVCRRRRGCGGLPVWTRSRRR
jgi:hypothetical protein